MDGWIELLGGGVLLYLGAEWLVGGASSLALLLRVPQIIVGVTVVAYGTSAPEVIVGTQAAAMGRGGVALGNVLGSNIANIGLILGLSALVKPARVDGSLRSRELPVLLVSAVLVPLALWDSNVSRAEGAALVSIAIVYTAVMVRAVRSQRELVEARAEVVATSDAADLAGAPAPSSAWRSSITAATGLLILLVGGHLFVGGSVAAARALGMSDRLVGLTIVAVGTSLPELVTSLIAARRGHSDIAIGNVIGSNIFNVFLCLGVSAAVAPIAQPIDDIMRDLAAMLGMTILAAVFIRTERVMTRAEGAILLGLYAGFTAAVLVAG